jgi:hypothetical protein
LDEKKYVFSGKLFKLYDRLAWYANKPDIFYREADRRYGLPIEWKYELYRRVLCHVVEKKKKD